MKEQHSYTTSICKTDPAKTEVFESYITDHKRIKLLVGCNLLTSQNSLAYTYHCHLWYQMGKLHEKYEVIANMPRRMSIDNMRNQSAKAALYNDCDYLVFYDDDVLLEKTAIDKLIESMESSGAGIGAGLTYVRAHPFKSMAFKKVGEDAIDHISWEDIENGPEIQEVDAIGFSLAAISTKVLAALEPPFFLTGPNFTEDVYFCLKAKENLPDLKIILNKNIQTDHIVGDYTISHKNRKFVKEFEENVFEARTENSDFSTADIEGSISRLQTPANS